MKVKCLLIGVVVLFVVGLLTFSSYAKIDPKTCVGIWLFDEGKGDIAKDSSGNGHHGEIRGAKWVDGRFGKALEFDGKSAVVIPHNDVFILEFFTVTGWVKCGDHVDWQTIMTKTGADEGAQPRNYGMFVIPNHGGIHFSLSITKIDSNEKVTDEEWHFVVMTRDKDNMLQGYIDGIKVVEGNSEKPGVNNEAVSIGACGGGTRYWLIGSVDEVAIFNKALSEDEVNSFMNSSIDKLLSVEPTGKLTTTWANIKAQ
ncbi:MAG: LamG domain-containing protein [Candidatus Doudnabacteria bacterium]